MNYPEIMDTTYRLGLYKAQKSWSNAQLSADMIAFGWQEWTEGYLESLFAGRVKADEENREYMNLYLLDRYSREALS